MATSASRSRLFPARSRKSYRLEMESRTLYLLLSLMTLTGVVIFYLGVVTGKALRDPNAPVTLSAQMGTALAPPGEAAQPGALAFSEALKGDQTAVEGLREEGRNASRQTEALISEAQKQLELKEVTPATPPAAPKVAAAATPSAAPPAAPRSDAPAAPAAPRASAPGKPAAPDGELYTVQVFSSQRQDSALQLMERLRGQGFAAYLNRFEAADRQVWYRVRVGKTDKASAEELQARLKSEARLKNPQVQKL
jgi:cell division septation protein DedD